MSTCTSRQAKSFKKKKKEGGEDYQKILENRRKYGRFLTSKGLRNVKLKDLPEDERAALNEEWSRFKGSGVIGKKKSARVNTASKIRKSLSLEKQPKKNVRWEQLSPSTRVLRSRKPPRREEEQKKQSKTGNATEESDGRNSSGGVSDKGDSSGEPSRANKAGVKSSNGGKTFLSFIVDSEDFVNVYVAGACTHNDQSNPRAGVGVWFGDDHPLNISQAVDGPPTYNNAEIQAARLAIETAAEADLKKLRVKTDSEYLIKCMTSWMANGWTLSTAWEMKNRDELEKLNEAGQKLDIEWTKVPAHSGVHGNEMAEKLASAGTLKRCYVKTSSQGKVKEGHTKNVNRRKSGGCCQ